jgi:signal transduction histidine kinase
MAAMLQRMQALYHEGDAIERRAPVGRVIDDVLALLGGRGCDRGLTITCERSDEAAAVMVPECALHQVLLNLLDNAIAASPANETILVSASVEAGALCIAVADRGPGIDPAVGARVYEPFFTRRPGSGDGRLGLGLGLPITRRLVVSLRGAIDFAPREGGGTVFTVTLLLTPGRGGGPAAVEPRDPGATG